MTLNKKFIVAVLIALLIYVVALNEWNIYTIQKNNPENTTINAQSLVFNSTIYSIDNYWYVSQIKNYNLINKFTIDPDKYNYTVRRTPIYPLFYGIHYLLFGEAGSYYYIRFTQIALFILATVALFFATFNFTKNKKIAFLSAFLFGFNPTLVCYLYFTITESVSPALVCFLLYFTSLCYTKGRNRDWSITGFVFAVSSLCRPTVFIFGGAILFLIYCLYSKNRKKFFIYTLVFGGGMSIVFTPYIIRNYLITNNEIIILEKYYDDPMDYGLPNMELRHWISCWKNPADFSSENISNRMLLNILSDSSLSKNEFLKLELEKLPEEAYIGSNEKNIKVAYSALYEYYSSKSFLNNVNKTDSLEKIAFKHLQYLSNHFIRQNPFRYYILTPMQIVKSIVVQSNSSVIRVLDNYKDNIFKKAVKVILYVLNIFLFFSLLGNLFFVRKYIVIYGMVLIFVMVNILFITFKYRYIEARYLIPLFPGMYILSSIFVVEVFRKLSKKLNL